MHICKKKVRTRMVICINVKNVRTSMVICIYVYNMYMCKNVYIGENQCVYICSYLYMVYV